MSKNDFETDLNPAAIGQITAEAMDTSKSQFLPLPSTIQVLDELVASAGPFGETLREQARRIAEARDDHHSQCYDQLVGYA